MNKLESYCDSCKEEIVIIVIAVVVTSESRWTRRITF